MKLYQAVGSNVSQKIPLTKDNKGGKQKMVLVDEYDDKDNESLQVDHDVHDESQEMDDMLQRYNQYEIQWCSNSKSNAICKQKRIQMVTTSIVSNERIGDLVHDNHVEDNQVSKTQVHQANDIRGAPKKVRGHTSNVETWKMDSTQRIVVMFNKFEKPVGMKLMNLFSFLGHLIFKLEKGSYTNKEDMHSLVKTKFVFHSNETNEIKNWILYSMGKKWRAWKCPLKARLYDPSLIVDEIVAQVKNDKRASQTQFKELATRWFTPKFQSTCMAKRVSQSKMKEPHVSGTESFARPAHEMNDVVYPTRGEMYTNSQTHIDGTIVDDEASLVM
ncbi:hypothetical protein R6Q59_031144, partial [Mikania micrantha]